jgi:hypothetical protein
VSDFTLFKSQTNAGAAVTDASPTWVDMPFATANNELRLCATGAGATTTSSALWPSFLRPASVSVIPEMYAFTADTTGLKMNTYDGTSAHYMQWRINWDATGTFAAPNILSAWKDITLPAAVPGTQPAPTAGGDGSSFVNGANPDTGTSPITSYIKATAFGSGVNAAGTQETPSSNAGGTLAVTTGTAAAANTTAAAWMATWQQLQSATGYIQSVAIPKAVTAGFWYILLSFWTGPGMTGGTLLPILGVQYQWV